MWHQKELGITIRELMASGASKDEILKELSPGGERYISENGKILTIRSYIGQLFPRKKSARTTTKEYALSKAESELLNQCALLFQEPDFAASLYDLVQKFQAQMEERASLLAHTQEELGKLSFEKLKLLNEQVVNGLKPN